MQRESLIYTTNIKYLVLVPPFSYVGMRFLKMFLLWDQHFKILLNEPMPSSKKRQKTETDKQTNSEKEADRQTDKQGNKNRQKRRKMVGWLVRSILWLVA